MRDDRNRVSCPRQLSNRNVANRWTGDPQSIASRGSALSVGMMAVDLRDEVVLAQCLRRSEDRSASINNSGRVERDSVRVRPATSARTIITSSSLARAISTALLKLATLALSGGRLNGPGAACYHVGGELGIIAIVANHDPERKKVLTRAKTPVGPPPRIYSGRSCSATAFKNVVSNALAADRRRESARRSYRSRLLS